MDYDILSNDRYQLNLSKQETKEIDKVVQKLEEEVFASEKSTMGPSINF